MKTPHGLPEPHPVLLAKSAALADLIRAEIETAGGWISFARYMEMALYTPGMGYYANIGEKFGESGDFITAPELTPLFARALARQIEEIMTASAPAILEFGAGSGQLAVDLLQALTARNNLPQSYQLLEISAELQARQQAALANAPVPQEALGWLKDLPEAFSGVVLANELLDAMPVHLVAWRHDGIYERGVALDDQGHFCFAEQPATGDVLLQARTIAAITSLTEDYLGEMALAAPAWVADWGERLHSGALLLIDYGHSRRELYHAQRHGGTLRCHYRHHAHNDPFFLPGLQDITAHVDFTGLALAGEAAGLELYGFTTQARFLLNCGLLDELAAMGTPESREYRQAAAAIHRLLLPQGMGESFKVIALGKGIDGQLCGFSQGDRSFSL